MTGEAKTISQADEDRINRMIAGVAGLLIMEYGPVPVYEAVQTLARNEKLWLMFANGATDISDMARTIAKKVTGTDPGPMPGTPEGRA